MAIQIRPLSQHFKLQGVKCCVYGGSSAGKTSLTLTCPRPVYIGCEKGALSLVRKAPNLPSVEIQTMQEIMDVHQWVMQSNEAKQFDTIVVDSVSEMGDVILRTQKRATANGLKAHGDANERVLNGIYRDFRDMQQKHVYMIAKEKSFASTLNPGQRFYTPSMPNETMRNELPYFFDLVMRLAIYPARVQGQLPERWMQTYADANTIAKDRSHTLDPYEQPDLGRVFAKMMGT